MEPTLRSDWKGSCIDSFGELMRLWQSQPYSRDTDEVSFQKLILSNSAVKQIFDAGPCITWILNIRTGQFLFISKNIEALLGYSTHNFMKGGIEYINDLLHPDDATYLWKLRLHVWQYLLDLSPLKRKNYQFNCDYRLRKATGIYTRFLEQNRVLQTDNKGNITHVLGMCTDITNWKKNDTLTSSVSSVYEETCIVHCSSDGHIHPYELLSKREKEILKLVADGYKSKEIAARLNISFHTVIKHRQNIIEKTHRRNTGEVIQFAINNAII